jgi:predicted neutral ceramidase superfamily lipid hydrolase
MNISLQRKIHYLSLATLFMGGLGLLEGKWYETITGGVLCVSSAILGVVLLPTLLKHVKSGKWNKSAFLLEFTFFLVLALVHVIQAHYPLSIILMLLSFLPAIAWIRIQ